MIAARRIARSLVRKLTKPLRLAVLRHQLVLSEGNVAALEEARQEAVELLKNEHRRQVKLLMQRNQIAGW